MQLWKSECLRGSELEWSSRERPARSALKEFVNFEDITQGQAHGVNTSQHWRTEKVREFIAPCSMCESTRIAPILNH